MMISRGRGNRAEGEVARKMKNRAEDEIARKKNFAVKEQKETRAEEGGDVDNDLLSSRGDVDSDLKGGSDGMDQNRSDTMTNPTQGLEEKNQNHHHR